MKIGKFLLTKPLAGFSWKPKRVQITSDWIRWTFLWFELNYDEDGWDDEEGDSEDDSEI